MLEYNKRLASPGQGGLVQWGEPPPSGRTFPGSTPGWDRSTPADLARIENQYGGGTPGRATVTSGRNNFYPAHAGSPPSVPATPPAVIAPVTSPHLSPPPPAPNPIIGSAAESATAAGQSIAGPSYNPDGSPVVPQGNETGARLSGVDPSKGRPLTAEERGPAINPATGQPVAPVPGEKTIGQQEADRIARLKAQGASDATIHRAQVEAGIRPNIDARATPSALNSTTSSQIQAKWAEERAAKLAAMKAAAQN